MEHFDANDPLHQELISLLGEMVERDRIQPTLERWELERLAAMMLIAKAHTLRARIHWLLADRP